MQHASMERPTALSQRALIALSRRIRVRRDWRFAACLIAIVLGPALQAQYARTPLRNITGTVTDAGQEPLRGAIVQIEALDTLVIQSYETNESGEYHFRNLRSDADFSVWATFRANRSKSHNIGKFDHKLDRDIPLTVVLDK